MEGVTINLKSAGDSATRDELFIVFSFQFFHEVHIQESYMKYSFA